MLLCLWHISLIDIRKMNWWSLKEGPLTKGLPTVILTKGTSWFRADRTGATVPSADVPAFFTTKELLGPYKGTIGNAAISSYTVDKEAKLFDLTFNSLAALHNHPELTDEERELIEEWFKIDNSPPYLFVSSLRAEDVGKRGEYLNYANRRAANLICRLGFDGWIVKPFDPKRRTGVLQISVARVISLIQQLGEEIPLLEAIPLMAKHFPDEVIVGYPAEIMLCNWDKFMSRHQQGGSRRKTRRNINKKSNRF